MALTQLGALLDLEHLGYSVAQAKPLAVLGHSQGVLAVHMTRAIEAAGSIEAAGTTLDEILAVAALIGAAGTRRVRELGLNPKYGEASPMLSVKGATREQVEALVARVNNARGPISIAVTNSDNHHVLSGYPEDLAAFALEAEREHQHQAKLREQKLHGGTVFNPTLEYLEVTLPFHSPLMADAVEQTVAWAGACGFDQKRTRALAEEVLLNHVDWNARVKALFDDADPSKLWIVDLGPGNTLGKLIGNVVQGTGIGVVEATTLAERSTLSMLESEPERTQNWKAFAPRVINTPAGAKLVTKFSKLTGKPPVLLPGMTPTTVEPEIVAAAANAGYWAELAGGGQVTAEVFDRHIAALPAPLTRFARLCVSPRPWPPPPSWFRLRAVKPAATTAGKRWMTCLPPPTPKCAPATTSCWSPAAASAPLNALPTTFPASGPTPTACPTCRSTVCLSVPPR